MSNTYNKYSGFTLIELLVTIVIIGIFLTLSFPCYQQYLQKARRTDAQSALYDSADFLEEYYIDNKSYEDAELLYIQTPGNWYRLSIITQTATTFTLKATPQKSQMKDTLCQSYTLTNTGVKGITEGPEGFPTGVVSDCW